MASAKGYLVLLILSMGIVASLYPALGENSGWVRFFGGEGTDKLTAVVTAPNGDILASGLWEINSSLSPVLIRVDRYGNALWAKYYITDVEGLHKWVKVADVAINRGGDTFLLGSAILQVGSELKTVTIILKLNGDGKVLWAKMISGNKSYTPLSLFITDNWLYVIGFTEEASLWTIGLNPYGDPVWGREYPDFFPSMKGRPILKNSTLLIPGIHLRRGEIGFLRIKPTTGVPLGTTLYNLNTAYGDPILIDDSGDTVLLVGSTTSLCLAKGETLCYRFPQNVTLSGAIGGEGRIFSLMEAYRPPNEGDVFLFSVKDSGKVELSRVYTLGQNDEPSEIALDEGTVIVGHTDRFGSQDGFVMKLPYNGALEGYNSEDVEPEVFFENLSTSETTTPSKNVVARVTDITVLSGNLSLKGFLHVIMPRSVEAAEVSVDGKGIPIANEAYLRLPPGTHNIVISAEGYAPYEVSVQIRAGVETELKPELIPKPEEGRLFITSNPPGAEILLNDTFIGATPLNLTLSPGEYRITVSLSGYGEVTKTLTIKGGENKTLIIDLSRISTTSTQTTSTISSSTENPHSTTSPSQTTSSTTSTKGGKKGICGPGFILLIILPLVWRVKESR